MRKTTLLTTEGGRRGDYRDMRGGRQSPWGLGLGLGFDVIHLSRLKYYKIRKLKKGTLVFRFNF